MCLWILKQLFSWRFHFKINEKKKIISQNSQENPCGEVSVYKKVIDRSLSSEVVARMCSVKICSKFTGEHPCLSVMSIKLLCRFIEITLCHGCSPVNLLQQRCFLRTFGRYLRHRFYRTPPGNYFCSTGKYFTNKIVKNPQKK